MAKDYFHGWYFKCMTSNKSIAMIPALHRCNGRETASLQIITDDATYNIPIHNLEFQESPLFVRIGNSIFCEKGIQLHIHTKQIHAEGVLRFKELTSIRYDIMGPFQFVPFMQCRHRVYSMRHRIDGILTVNGQQYIFRNGIGYLEGDRGYSFPSQYLWTQCIFPNGSLMLSVADVPLMGLHFHGVIGVVIIDGQEHRIATCLGAKLDYIHQNTVVIKQGDYCLTAKMIQKHAKPLNAPEHGKMSRMIHESLSCKAFYRFEHHGRILCEFVSDRASFEFEF
ncbi:MAG: tocopherol cyclase family protein [Oscillospiraceae bacterium]|nr:tocopherol cyclase family protein [Oscillospiraceae bacterium]